MKKLLQAIIDTLAAGETAVLAAICQHGGSTPRTSGAKMLIRRDGTIAGTIGGGLLEAETMRQAARLFIAPPHSARRLPFELSGADAAASDMICGGCLGVLLERAEPTSDSLELFRQTLDLYRSGRRVCLVTDLKPDNDGLDSLTVTGRHVLTGDIIFPDAPAVSQAERLRTLADEPETRLVHHDGLIRLVEPLSNPGLVVLAGGGHVAQQTAVMAAFVGFRVAVLDDRPEFANPVRFPQAERIVVTPEYADCFRDIETDENTYIAIMTRGHSHDRAVLAQALLVPAAYVGMIGSRRKRDAVYAALIDEGCPADRLNNVYSPIGLDISSDTPEEIAVSIVAQLIKVRAERRKNGR